MPKPTTKSRQELRSRFVRNAIPTEADFADLIAASLNLADDGLLKLPDQAFSLVRQKADQPVLRFFADPAAEGAVWQMQLIGTEKPGFGLAGQDGQLALVVDGATGNVGIGTPTPGSKLTVQGPVSTSKDPDSGLRDAGQLAIKSTAPQLDFIDSDSNSNDWAIQVNGGKLSFVRPPWNNKDLVLDGGGCVGIGTDTPQGELHISETIGTAASALKGTLLLDHEDVGGASSVVFRSKVDRGNDHAFLEYRDKNPNINDAQAGLLTIGIQNDANDHLALMPSGNVGIGTTTPGYKLDVNGSIRIGGFSTEEKDEWPNLVWCRDTASKWDEGLLKHTSQRGFFGRQGFGIHMDTSRSFHLFSSNWTSLLGVEGGTGNTSIRGNLAVQGTLLRGVWFATGNGPVDDTDNGQIKSRVLKVTKRFGDKESALRILYCDNFRVIGNESRCRWEIRVDGKSLGTPIIADRYHQYGNFHVHGTIMGYARGLAAGSYEIQVWVGPLPGQSTHDAAIGWHDSTWCLEAEEIRLP